MNNLIVFAIWFIVGGLGGSVFLFGCSLIKEAFVQVFIEHEFFLGFAFLVGGFMLLAISLLIIYVAFLVRGIA